MAGDTYLFIDGEYLRQRHRQAMQDFFGVDGELELSPIKEQSRARRVYFYDCIDEALLPGEKEESRRTRIAPLEAFLSRVQALSGFHVRPGTVRRGKKREQKEIDVSLAVDMLTHGFNGTMSKAVLLSGDLDFRPVVEALVRQGVFVEIWYHRDSIAEDLPGAADFGRELRFRQLYSWNTDAFQREHRIPDDRPIHSASVRSGQLVRSGSLANSEWPLELYEWRGHGDRRQFELWIGTCELESIVIRDEDRDLIDRYVQTQYSPIKWELGEQELREINVARKFEDGGGQHEEQEQIRVGRILGRGNLRTDARS